jgi:hypothetical protein
MAFDAGSLKLGDYLGRWLDSIENTLRRRTWIRHEEVVQLHLKPSLRYTKLDRVSALQVQSLYRSKLDSGHSPRTVQIIRGTLQCQSPHSRRSGGPLSLGTWQRLLILLRVRASELREYGDLGSSGIRVLMRRRGSALFSPNKTRNKRCIRAMPPTSHVAIVASEPGRARPRRQRGRG